MEREKLVVVAEDEPQIRSVIRKVLTRGGLNVHLCDNGEDAWQFLQANKEKVDVILSDWMMPELNGVELLKRVKADQALRDVPFVMLTAKSEVDSQLEATKGGAFQYITKPFNNSLLLAKVQAAMQEFERFKKVGLEAKEEVEGIKSYAYSMIESYRKDVSFDLNTYQVVNQFFLDSLNCDSYEQLVKLLLKAIKKFSFDSSNAIDGDTSLRCSVRLASDEEVDVTDRGIISTLDKMILKKALEEHQVIQKNTITAIPSKSGRTAIMMRNTPTEDQECKLAMEIITNLLEMFDLRLLPFEKGQQNVKTMDSVYKFLQEIQKVNLAEQILDVVEESDIPQEITNSLIAICSSGDQTRQLIDQAVWGLKQRLYPEEIDAAEAEEIERLTAKEVSSKNQSQVDDLLASLGL